MTRFNNSSEFESVALLAEGDGSVLGTRAPESPRPRVAAKAPHPIGSRATPAATIQPGIFGSMDRMLAGEDTAQRPNGPRRGPSRTNWLYVLVVCSLVAYLFYSLGGGVAGAPQATKLATSDFVTAVEEGRVESATYTVLDGSVKGSYWEKRKDVGDKKDLKAFTSTYVGNDSLAELMAEHPKTEYRVDTSDPNFLTDLLVAVLPTLVLIFMMFYFMRQMTGANNKAMQFGKTDAKTSEATRPNVKFKDVAGIEEAVEELTEIRDFLAEPERFRKLGAKIPRGVLLVGPPGTGKTLLAKAVAGEAGVPFFSISGSDFVEMFVGVGASRVRDLFEKAKAQSPSIIFIDEIDAVGRQRGAGLGGGHDEREQTLNQLLVEMDGFEDSESVILIAATNRPDILDPALLRPGRFDRQITVDRPDVRGREQILRVHAANKPLDEDVSFDKIAQLTVGFTGADLRQPAQRVGAARRPTRSQPHLDGRDRGVDGARHRGPRAQEPRHERERAHDDRLPRGGPRARRPRARQRRPRPQDLDHQPRPGARLHDAAARGGPLPQDARRDARRARRVPGRPCRRGAHVRGHHLGCQQRSGACDQDGRARWSRGSA